MTGNDLALTTFIAAAAAAQLVRDYQRTPFDALFDRIGVERSVPSDLLRSLARQESGFDPAAVSKPNANGTRDWGLMQINESTARAMGRDVQRLLDPEYAVETAAELLRRLRVELGAQFSEFTWIAAYNAGAPAILRRGVFNVAYASAVSWHLQLYRLARLLRGRTP